VADVLPGNALTNHLCSVGVSLASSRLGLLESMDLVFLSQALLILSVSFVCRNRVSEPRVSVFSSFLYSTSSPLYKLPHIRLMTACLT